MNCPASLRLVFHILISFSGDVMDIRRMGDSYILPEITTTLLEGRAWPPCQLNPLYVHEQDGTLRSQHSLIVVLPQGTKVSKGRWRFLRFTFCTKPCHIRSLLLWKLHHAVHGAYNCWKFFSAQCDSQAWGLIRTYCIIKNISLTGLSKCL